MKIPAHFTRMTAVIGATATIVSALVFGAPAAQAFPNEPARAAETGTTYDPTNLVRKVFLLQSNGTIVEAPPGTDTSTLSAPYIEQFFSWPDDPDTRSFCNPGEMCMWSQNYYKGLAVYMGGAWPYCTGVRFENTDLQDHVYSIWNRVYPGPSSLWNRASDGSYRYEKYAYVNPGYFHDTQFTRVIDAWAYDPAKTCRTEMLHLLTIP